MPCTYLVQAMISQATIIGRSHRLMQQNCHDFAITGTPVPGSAFGLVLDGCGSKYRDELGIAPPHNEVGAKLLGQFTAAYLTAHLPHQDPNADFLANLYTACTSYLYQLLSLLPTSDLTHRARFIATHLLCTIVGFLVKGETGIFFWSGDGYLTCNGQVTQLDSNNHPDYLAYQLNEEAWQQRNGAEGSLHLPISRWPTFHSQTIYQPRLVGVTSDGWTADLISRLDTPQPSLALQRWLNIRAKERGNFEDDGAVAIWWRDTS